ncbi:MAG: tetratricopeptide repeat protein [Elusimicrobiota bacterium]|jgi:predicted TPR repeat methyltransferase
MRTWIAVCAFAVLFVGGAAALARAHATAAELSSEEREKLYAVRAGLEESLRTAPADAELWRRLGLLEQRLGEPRRALEAFKKVVELRPEDASAWFMLGLIHEKLGDVYAAVEAWEKCLRFAKTDKESETARRHLARLRP